MSNLRKAKQFDLIDKFKDIFGFPIVYLTWLRGDDSRLPSYGIYISEFDLLDALLAFWFTFRKSSNHFKTIDTELQITQASENVWEIL